MSEVSMGLLAVPPGAESTPTSNDPGDLDLIKYMEETLMAIAAFNVQGLKSVMMKLDKESLQDGMRVMVKELDDLFERFNSQQVSVIKKSLQVFAEGGKMDLTEIEKLHDMMDLQEEINIVLDEPLLVPGSSTDETTSPSHSPQQSRGEQSEQQKVRRRSESWKQAVKGVLTKHRRARIRENGRDLTVKNGEHPKTRVVLKSESTKERLRTILR
jgi:hypothetical protein